MSLLTDQLAAEGVTDPEDVEWLHLLVGDWQLIADLSFADLVLWVPTLLEGEQAGAFRVVAHCRPTTGSTVYPHDEVGTLANEEERGFLQRALDAKAIVAAGDTVPALAGAEAIPVVREGHVIALLTRHTEEGRRIGASRLERNYRSSAMMLLSMIAEGEFPQQNVPSGVRRGEPRVGDGLLVLNREGRVRYASPNGMSVLHRLGHDGEIEGRYLNEVVDSLIDQVRQVDEALPMVLTGRASWRAEIEEGRISVSLRSIPLKRGGVRTGAILLVRDVSEVRRRERELLSRDAMIREMHHRVKNNLQTVSALLRLQERRLESPEAKAAVGEAMRRVQMIATVHDVLSKGIESSVDFDEIIDKGMQMAPELATAQASVHVRREGSFGSISSADATSLALALNELVANAVEHGFPVDGLGPDDTITGEVVVRPVRHGERLTVTVSDDGVGLPPGGGPGNGLGTQIVKTLIKTDLSGDITWRPGPAGGTEAVIEVPLRDGV